MKGQSLVEFGVALVILLFLLSGLVEFGIIFFQYVQLKDAAQEGAVFGSACNCTVADIEERAINSSNKPINLLTDPGVSIQITATRRGISVDPEFACEGDAMTVRIQYIHKIFMPFLPQMLGATHINLNAAVVNTVLVPLCP